MADAAPGPRDGSEPVDPHEAIDPEALRDTLERRARELGFDAFGIAPAEPLDGERVNLETWLARGYAGTMDYLHRLGPERLDPDALLPGARSVIVVALNYGTDHGRPDPAPDPPDPDAPPRIARYARGRDYHKVLRTKLRALGDEVVAHVPGARTRAAVDTAPLLEKAWAERAGIGWRGKHTNLVLRGLGSWTFLGELLTDVVLPPDRPHTDFCGSCRRCLDACPTDAFPEPYVLDARRCISYLTIEHRGDLTDAEGAAIGDHLFGCDLCLEACPWNRFASPATEPDLASREHVTERPLSGWTELDEDDYDAVTRGSAMRRARREGLRRSARHVARNRGTCG